MSERFRRGCFCTLRWCDPPSWDQFPVPFLRDQPSLISPTLSISHVSNELLKEKCSLCNPHFVEVICNSGAREFSFAKICVVHFIFCIVYLDYSVAYAP